MTMQNHLVKICHYLGGSTRKRPNRHITHLIADSINGNNYWYGPTFNVPVMARSWIITAWERRHDIEYSCQNPDTVCLFYLIILKLGLFTTLNFFTIACQA